MVIRGHYPEDGLIDAIKQHSYSSGRGCHKCLHRATSVEHLPAEIHLPIITVSLRGKWAEGVLREL